MFANGSGDQVSISGWLIPKTQKVVLDTSLLSRVKRRNPKKGVEPSPTPRNSSYWKGSFRVALNYGRQLYFYPKIRPSQVPTLQAKEDQGAMAIKWYSAFPEAPALLNPHHQIVLSHNQDIRWGGVLPLCGESVGAFCSPSRLGHQAVVVTYHGW